MNSNLNKDIIVNILLITIVVLEIIILKYKKHQLLIKKALSSIKKINSFKEDVKKLSYLKKIDKKVFKEIIFSSFEKLGIKTQRDILTSNIDGYIYINNIANLIQIKKYNEKCNPLDANYFNKICTYRNMNGYFFHTGKNIIRENEKEFSAVKIIDENKLLNLIAGNIDEIITTN